MFKLIFVKTILSCFIFLAGCVTSFFAAAQNTQTDGLLPPLTRDTTEVIYRLAIFEEQILVNPDSARAQLDTALVLSQKLHYQKGIADVCQQYGYYYNLVGEYERAKKMNDRAETIYTDLGMETELAACYNQQAISAAEMGDYDKALTVFYETEKIYQQVNNVEEQVNIKMNIGSMHVLTKAWEKALINFEEAAVIAEEFGFKDASIGCYSNLANVYSKMGDFEKAVTHSKRAIEAAVEINSLYRLSSSYHNLGTIYEREQMSDSALVYWKKALDGYVQLDQMASAAYIRLNIANVMQQRKEYQPAIAIANQSLEAGKKMGVKRICMDSYSLLCEIYRNKGDYKKALENAEFYYNMRDSLQGEDMQGKIREIETKYETEKKEEAIVLLQEKDKVNKLELAQKESSIKNGRYFVAILAITLVLLAGGGYFTWQQNKLRQQKNAAELEQKVLRAQMNPHFIFNSLNSIQRMYIEGKNDQANEYTADFAELIRKILENSDKNRITLAEEIKTLELYLQLEKLRCKGQVNYEIKMDEELDARSIMVPPLIFQPFVENAIWHGILPKDEPGMITISIEHEGNKLKGVVRDDGVGIDPQKKAKHHESKGIHITEQRIGSKVQIVSYPGKGTSVTFYLDA